MTTQSAHQSTVSRSLALPAAQSDGPAAVNLLDLSGRHAEA